MKWLGLHRLEWESNHQVTYWSFDDSLPRLLCARNGRNGSSEYSGWDQVWHQVFQISWALLDDSVEFLALVAWIPKLMRGETHFTFEEYPEQQIWCYKLDFFSRSVQEAAKLILILLVETWNLESFFVKMKIYNYGHIWKMGVIFGQGSSGILRNSWSWDK